MPKVKDPNKLTAKQRLFCENYVSNGYKLQKAYMDAYDCSPENANARSWELMKKDSINQYIREIQHERFEALHITADKIAQQLAEIADDPESTKTEKMRALELIQKQMGLQTQKAEVEVKTTTFSIDLDDEPSN